MHLFFDANATDIKVRVHRGEDVPDLLFSTGAAALREAGDDIRETLNTLNQYSADNPTFSQERDEGWARYREILAELKGKGQELYLCLFRRAARSAASAQRLEEEILKLPCGANLNATCSGEGLTVPLGFLYNADLDIGDAPVRPPSRADFDDMWINRFNINWLLDGCDCSAHERALDAESFRTLFALHQKELDRALTELLKDGRGDYLAKYQALTQLEVGQYAAWSDFKKAYANIADFDSVVFIFAHAEQGATLHLGSGPTAELGTHRFAEILKQRAQSDKSALVILNCCASVTSRQSGSLLGAVAAAENAYCGLVGTEAEILNTPALRCGVHLMWEMCFQGRSLGDAFQSMQAAPELFPHNLFYSCYAPRKFQLDKPLANRSNDEQARLAGTPVA